MQFETGFIEIIRCAMHGNIEFDDNAIRKHWSKYPQLEAFFKRMSSAEVWVLENEATIKARVANWVESLDSEALCKLNENLTSLLTVLAFLSVQSSIYLLQELEAKLPGLTNSLTSKAKTLLNDEQYNRPAKILIERLSAAHTQVSLQQLLNNERLALVYAALNNVHSKKGELR